MRRRMHGRLEGFLEGSVDVCGATLYVRYVRYVDARVGMFCEWMKMRRGDGG